MTQAKVYDKDNLTNHILLGCVFVLYLFVPNSNNLEFSDSTISSKTFSFLFLLAFVIAVWAIKRLPVKADIKISRIDIFLFFLFCYLLLNRYIFHQIHGFSLRFIDLIGLGILYIILRLFSVFQQILLFLSVMITGIYQSILGIIQSINGSMDNVNNIKGSFMNSGPFAGFLMLVGCVAIALYLNRVDLWSRLLNEYSNQPLLVRYLKFAFKYLILSTIFFVFIAVPSTRSRAAVISALIITGYLFLRHVYAKINLTGIKNAVFKVAGAVIFIMLALIMFLNLYKLKKVSADGRLLIWKVTERLITEKPLTGVGFDRFKAYYMSAQADYFTVHKQQVDEIITADNTYYAFNEFLQFTVENGFIGLFFLMLFVISLITVNVKEDDFWLKHLCLTVLAGWFIFSMFSYPSEILPIKLITILILASLATQDRQKIIIGHSNSVYNNSYMQGINKGVVLLFCLTISFLILKETYRLRTAFREWQSGLMDYTYGSYTESIRQFNKAYPVLHENGDFLMTYGKTLAIAGNNRQAKEILDRARIFTNNTVIEIAIGDACKQLKLFNSAESAYKTASLMVPNRFYPRYLLIKLYKDTGRDNQAYLKAKEVLGMKVKIRSHAILEIEKELKYLIFEYDSARVNRVNMQIVKH